MNKGDLSQHTSGDVQLHQISFGLWWGFADIMTKTSIRDGPTWALDVENLQIVAIFGNDTQQIVTAQTWQL